MSQHVSPWLGLVVGVVGGAGGCLLASSARPVAWEIPTEAAGAIPVTFANRSNNAICEFRMVRRPGRDGERNWIRDNTLLDGGTATLELARGDYELIVRTCDGFYGATTAIGIHGRTSISIEPLGTPPRALGDPKVPLVQIAPTSVDVGGAGGTSQPEAPEELSDDWKRWYCHDDCMRAWTSCPDSPDACQGAKDVCDNRCEE